jgi:hypothetical protein
MRSIVTSRQGHRLATALAALGLCAALELSAAAQDLNAAGISLRRPAAAAVTPPAVAAAPKQARRYFVEFKSRSAASYGHTFLVHGRVGSKGEVAGLHPATDSPIPWMIGHILLVPSETGASDGDTEEQYTTARYRIVLNETEYGQVAAYIRQLQASSPVWHAALYNCNAFVGDVARFMGLRTPPSTLVYPQSFITALRDLNKGRTQGLAMAVASAPSPEPSPDF